MLRMQQKPITKIDPTYRDIFWTEKKNPSKLKKTVITSGQ